MLNSYISTFKKYNQFSGRSGRSEFWTFVLFQFLINIAITILGYIFTLISEYLGYLTSFLYFVFFAATLLPYIAVLVRRLHDTGRSGWWYWISLVPLVGPIVLIVFLASPSQEADNQFGPKTIKS